MLNAGGAIRPAQNILYSPAKQIDTDIGARNPVSFYRKDRDRNMNDETTRMEKLELKKVNQQRERERKGQREKLPRNKIPTFFL